MFPLEFCGVVDHEETRVMGLSSSDDRMIVAGVVSAWYRTVTNRQTDRRTDRQTESIIANTRDVKSSRPKWPRGQNFGLGLGLGLKALASASALASNIWPRPGLSLQQKNQQPRRDRLTNLFADSGHHSMIEDKLLCEREWEIKRCRLDHNDINSPVRCQPSFDTFYS